MLTIQKKMVLSWTWKTYQRNMKKKLSEHSALSASFPLASSQTLVGFRAYALSSSLNRVFAFLNVQFCILCSFLQVQIAKFCNFRTLFVFFIILKSAPVFADSFAINLDAIAKIESSGNSGAIGDNGKSRGLFQLSYPVIQEYNSSHHTRYKHNDALNPLIARSIADWYFEKRIPAILHALKLPVNTRSKIVCFNAGCGALKRPSLPKITKAYLKKYQAFGGKL